MKNRKSGFTLMEIMVVIIVIAVLASVAGPMIGSITDQGRASATKSKMSSLKSAMLAYQSDVGRLPFAGNSSFVSKINAYNAEKVLSYDDESKNVLVQNYDGGTTSAFKINNYNRKWKGPYMDSDPSDFMFDAWGNEIHYVAHGHNVYLWSYGPDGSPDDGAEGTNIEKVLNLQSGENAGESDDIITSIARVRKAFTN